MERQKIARDLLNKIIEKRGLMGHCAKMYIEDPELSNQFLKECYQQCHNQPTIDHWGKELVENIIKYVESESPAVAKLNKERIKSYNVPEWYRKLKK